MLMDPESAPFAIAFFLGMVLFLELGRRIGRRMHADTPERAPTGVGAVEGAVFALFGLLLAFTFSGAASRFDDRRHLIIDEANDIGTAWSYLDLLPVNEQGRLRDLFRAYTDARIATFEKLPDVAAAEAELARSIALQDEIWKQAIALCEAKKDTATTNLVLGALNEMNNITTSRTAATRIHPPPTIFGLLFAMGLCSALLAGFGMAANPKRSWLHILGFAAAIALCVYVIRDIEYPRLGLIRVTATDQVMKDLRASMK
ncbi:DUF4239 domain-containing protein [Candidatus Accumulibacter phosphatis]|jgi:hypothetical protein|uniref:DUF4239 domain-containing protein n=1 Tax=Candidatus Accumulibacter phosphatis TaxID=327160 RepID=A0ABX1TSC5_9PROT|nr:MULTISPECIES: DUF4239 domain-containing protein [Candidatus Accumulibacter]NMQ27147.1 DUF4239 domain-containing protein [Candidatus Accumulibacter phosphatis]